MPAFSGLDTYRHLREVRHNLPIIFVTGDDTQMDILRVKSSSRGRRQIAILHKPFTIDKLSQTIKELLSDQGDCSDAQR